MLHEALHTMVLSQVLGFYLIIMAIIMAAKARFYRELLINMQPKDGYVLVSASVALFIGLFIISIHNIWMMGDELIVTVVGWIILVKSVLWLSLPEKMCCIAKKLYSGPGFYVIMFLMAVAGAALLVHNHHFLAR